MRAITQVAGVPVSHLEASIDWDTRFFARAPGRRVGNEVRWEIDEPAWLFIEPNAAWAGAGRITFAVAGHDALFERLAVERIEDGPIETHLNGVRQRRHPGSGREQGRVRRAARRSACLTYGLTQIR